MQVETPNRLRDQVAAMVGLEHTIEVRTAQVLRRPVGHQRVSSLVERIRHASRDRRAALASRLEAIAPGTPTPEPAASASALEVLSDGGSRPASGALLAAHALLTQAVMGYAILLEVAFRAADSIEHLGPENTGDLVWGHMRMCASQVQEVARLMPYVVVDELEEEGVHCRCECFTCGLGICGCPVAFRRRLDMALSEAGPTEAWPGVTMVTPRPGTPAAHAGLAKDDVVVAIDGKVIDSVPMLRESIEAHAPGDAIEFAIRRPDGRHETVTVLRPTTVRPAAGG